MKMTFRWYGQGNDSVTLDQVRQILRNVRVYDNGDFIETSHRAKDGSVDITDVVKAYHENGFTGYARPDHGRHLWGEKCRPGRAV